MPVLRRPRHERGRALMAELVRCRDCVFMETRQLFGGIDAKCYLDPEFNIFDGPDGYCSKARRRDGER